MFFDLFRRKKTTHSQKKTQKGVKQEEGNHTFSEENTKMSQTGGTKTQLFLRRQEQAKLTTKPSNPATWAKINFPPFHRDNFDHQTSIHEPQHRNTKAGRQKARSIRPSKTRNEVGTPESTGNRKNLSPFRVRRHQQVKRLHGSSTPKYIEWQRAKKAHDQQQAREKKQDQSRPPKTRNEVGTPESTGSRKNLSAFRVRRHRQVKRLHGSSTPKYIEWQRTKKAHDQQQARKKNKINQDHQKPGTK